MRGWGFNISTVEGEFHSEETTDRQGETFCYLGEGHASQTWQAGCGERESEQDIVTGARKKGKRPGRSGVPRFHRLYGPL